MARPKSGKTGYKNLDEDVILKLAERHWSNRQIAATFGCDEGVIRRRLSAKLENARQHGAAKLLDILWQRAVTEKSDRVLLNLADRIIGPVTQKVQTTSVDLSNKSNPEMIAELRQLADDLESQEQTDLDRQRDITKTIPPK